VRSRPSPHPSSPDDLARAAALADAAGQALVLATSAANDNSGVSAAQLRVLGVVDQAGSVNLTQLAVALHTAPSSASRLCDRLEAADLLRRTADERDRREVWLVLTPTARRLLDGLGRQRQETIAAVLRRMSPDDRAALLQGLTAFARASGVPLAEDDTAAQAS
jgi:DNA-binding MarR family transcriptional regulator